MAYIQNTALLSTTPQREIALSLMEAAFTSIAPTELFRTTVVKNKSLLQIQGQTFDLATFDRVFLLGFGKGSSGICKRLEELLGDRLTEGFAIDVVDETFQKISYTKGTHPLPSQTNIDFTNHVLERLTNLTEKDLVLVVICGGGSVLFEEPYKVNLETLTKTVDAMLKSGADITEMNVIRKHLSRVKGGGLSKHLYPATVASLIFSDVPGNDLSVIASGPTVPDHTTMEDVRAILAKYDIAEHVTISASDFTETATEAHFFQNVHNLMVLSNQTALTAMQKKAEALGQTAFVLTDHLQGDAHTMGEKLLAEAKSGQVLLAGGESTIKVAGTGHGGRNQALVMYALSHISDDVLLVAFDSDGWDFYELAGALADSETQKKVADKRVNIQQFMDQDDSYGFWNVVGDGIKTGKLESNVSDLYIVIKK